MKWESFLASHFIHESRSVLVMSSDTIFLTDLEQNWLSYSFLLLDFLFDKWLGNKQVGLPVLVDGNRNGDRSWKGIW